MNYTITLTLRADIGTLLATISEIESGNKDSRVGRDKEISRYQILPSVWIHYATAPLTQGTALNPAISGEVASRILEDRAGRFYTVWKRNPTPYELYALWHRPAEAYSAKLKPATKTRCARFENLYFAKLAETTPKKGQNK